jgi:N-acetyl-gamma-glutamyl-phosphate reductase
MAKTSVAVIGATGYAGATATSLLLGHPEVEVTRITSRSFAGKRLGEVWPGADTDLELFAEPDPGDADLVVVALPHGMAGGLAGKWLEQGRTVIDLGADFRLKDAGQYKRWYGADHPAPELLTQSVFGIPELTRGELPGARLVACPGCYSTAAILALWPTTGLHGVKRDFVVDAASGISGAGRSLALGYHFAEADEDFQAYGVTGHRHLPEMTQALTLGASVPQITFVPHLVPMIRGILVTAYIDLEDGVSAETVRDIYVASYSGEPFVRVVDSPPRTKEVAGTNSCLVHVTQQGGKVIILAAIDNLMKGAAGQAVQALNVVKGWHETTGLQSRVRWP